MKHIFRFRLKILVVLLFSLLFCLSVSSLSSINEDIGRHITLGEIIWQEKSVPKTNLFSFTEANYPFINQVWLSNVVFYGLYSLGNFKLLIITKVLIQLLSFGLIFKITYLILKKENTVKTLNFFVLFASFVTAFFIFSTRNDVRPEMFSLIFFCSFLYILFSAKYLQKTKLLWALPFIELLWVNFHVYYFLGLFLIAIFAVDRFFSRQIDKRVYWVTGLTFVVTLANPSFLAGALYFMNILRSYGMNVSENNSPFVLADSGYSVFINLYKFSLLILIGGFLLKIKEARRYIFEFALGLFVIFASLVMVRNFGIFAVVFAILVPLNFGLLLSKIKTSPSIGKWLDISLVAGFIFFITYFDYLLVTNKYYLNRESDVSFGLNVLNGSQNGVGFIKKNHLSGNVFNNYDVGGYLIWRLYPGQKVFMDQRPEAYSSGFFNNIYMPMLIDETTWQEYSKTYNIGYIFFVHRNDVADEAIFLKTRINDPNWRLIFLDDYSIIFVPNNKYKNLPTITKKSVLDTKDVKDLIDGKNTVSLNYLGHVLYVLDWYEQAISVYNKSLEINPKGVRSRIGRGFVYAKIADDKEKQTLALEDLKYAKKIGLKTPQFYLTIGQVYFNLGDFQNAKINWDNAVKKDISYNQIVESLKGLIPKNK